MMIADALPASMCVLVVPKASDNTPFCVIGAAIVGTSADHAAAEAWAKAHRQKTTPSKGQGGVDEQMIIFDPTTITMADLSDLYASSAAGKFGKAKLQVFMSPKATAADGIDLDTEAVVADADKLTVPTP